jgi:hypothetical protein
MTVLEERLRDALFAGAEQIEESPDLFARIKGSIEDERQRRAWRWRVVRSAAVAVAALMSLVASVTKYQEGALFMDWWILELITAGVLVAIVIVLGPFIKRFGRSYAAEVFRANPSTGKSFIVLMDFAYYLVFGAYALLTLAFQHGSSWAATVNAAQFKDETMKVAGILLLMGVLHGVNLLILPIIGRLLMLNRQLDMQMRDVEQRQPPAAGSGRADEPR